jgi:hypothetical protein
MCKYASPPLISKSLYTFPNDYKYVKTSENPLEIIIKYLSFLKALNLKIIDVGDIILKQVLYKKNKYLFIADINIVSSPKIIRSLKFCVKLYSIVEDDHLYVFEFQHINGDYYIFNTMYQILRTCVL